MSADTNSRMGSAEAHGECTCRLTVLSRLDRSGCAGIDSQAPGGVTNSSLAIRDQPLQ